MTNRPDLTFTVSGAADSGLLARIVGTFAQLGMPPPSMVVDVNGNDMSLSLQFHEPQANDLATVRRKISAFVGIDSCDPDAALVIR